LQNPCASIFIGEQSCKPSAQRRDQQRRRAKQARLSGADVPQRDQAGNDEAVDHDIKAVEAPAAKGGDQSALLGAIQIQKPRTFLHLFLFISRIDACTHGPSSSRSGSCQVHFIAD
jgi:hypothetical protein